MRPQIRTRLLLICAIAFAALLALAAALILKRDPQAAKREYFESGKKHFQEGRLREAVIELRNAIQIDPCWAEAHFYLGSCYLYLQEFGEAYKSFTLAADLDADNLDAHLNLGNLLLGSGRFDEAKERARYVLNKEANNVAALVLLANAYGGMKDFRSSLKSLEEAIRLDPRRGDAYVSLAQLKTATGDLEAAEKAFKRVIEIAPDSFQAHLSLANFYISTGRFSEAEETIKRAADIERAVTAGKGQSSLSMLAAFYFTGGKIEQAEEIYKRLVSDTQGDLSARLKLADFYDATGRRQEAIAIYQEIVKERPNDTLPRFQLASAYIFENQLDKAEEQIIELRKRNQRSAEANLLDGRVKLARGAISDAIARFNDFLKVDPASSIGRYFLAQALTANDDLAQAKQQLVEALKSNPQFLTAQLAIIEMDLSSGRIDDAIKSAQETAAAAPYNALARVVLAESYIEKRRLAEARAELLKAAELDGRSSLPYLHLGRIFALEKNYGKATEQYEAALRLNPDQDNALEGIIAILIEQNNKEGALARLQRQLEARPNTAAYHEMLGRFYINVMPELNRAEQSLLKAIEKDPARLSAYLALAEVYAQQQKFDLAMQQYRAVAQRRPNFAQVYVFMAGLEELRNNIDGAIENYRKALLVKPDLAIAANNLAWIIAEMGKGSLDEALALATTARRQSADNMTFADTLGWVYFKKGLYRQAIEQFQACIKREPEKALYHYHLSLALAKSNRQSEAREALNRALRLDPSLEERAEIRGVLSMLRRSGDRSNYSFG